MSSKLGKIKPLTAAIGAVFTVNLTPLAAAAAANPFGYSQLISGYLVADEGGGKVEGKCGEGKCGVKRMDTNGDGKVSKEEFMTMEENKFATMDADHDGTLDATEMKKMMEGKCGEGKCGVKRMDTNGDGKVSKEEFMTVEESRFAAMDTDKDSTLTAAETKKMMEGKCGEGKCGTNKKK